MFHRSPRSTALAALLGLTLVAGCGSTGPSAAPAASPSGALVETAAPSAAASASPAASSAPTAAPSAAAACPEASAGATFSPVPVASDSPTGVTFAKIEDDVQSLRGLTSTAPVPRNMLDQAGLCAFLRSSWDKDNPADYVAATETLYKLLGLLPADTSLQQLYLDLMTSQVIGFYDPSTKAMYVIAGTGDVGAIEKITYAHEFDHALQDQAFGIEKIVGTARDQSDRSLARHALVEGDATLLMSLWAQKNLTAVELGALAGASDPVSQAALNAAPPILKETLLWPYTAGLTLTLGAFQTSASFAGVDALWKNPPDTTEQLLHADKLASREPAKPIDLPAGLAKQLGAGWKVSVQDTLGELQLGILIRTGNAKAGSDPAAGWGGDRVSLLQGPNGGKAAVVQTVWDDATSADAYFQAIRPLVEKLNAAGGHATAAPVGDNEVTLVVADSDKTLGLLAVPLKLAQ